MTQSVLQLEMDKKNLSEKLKQNQKNTLYVYNSCSCGVLLYFDLLPAENTRCCKRLCFICRLVLCTYHSAEF